MARQARVGTSRAARCRAAAGGRCPARSTTWPSPTACVLLVTLVHLRTGLPHAALAPVRDARRHVLSPSAESPPAQESVRPFDALPGAGGVRPAAWAAISARSCRPGRSPVTAGMPTEPGAWRGARRRETPGRNPPRARFPRPSHPMTAHGSSALRAKPLAYSTTPVTTELTRDDHVTDTGPSSHCHESETLRCRSHIGRLGKVIPGAVTVSGSWRARSGGLSARRRARDATAAPAPAFRLRDPAW